MKRLILAVSNKRKSLDEASNNINNIGLTRYTARPNYDHNVVEIIDSNGNVVNEIRLATTPKTVTRRKFRKATQEDIDSGATLYVAENYDTTTDKQTSDPDIITDIVDKVKV